MEQFRRGRAVEGEALMRREFTRKVMAAAWKRAAGRCEGCTAYPIGLGHFDHIIPDAMGGEPTLENCQVLCRNCHGEKTAKRDVPAIAKAKRREARHIGAHKSRSPLPGGRGSPLKRKIGGGVVPR